MPQEYNPQLSRAYTQSTGAAVTFAISAVYIVLVTALVRLSVRLVPAFDSGLFGAAVTALLLTGGLLMIASLRVRQSRPLSAIGLVLRPSASREGALGAALGWGTAVALVLPGVAALQMRTTLQADRSHLAAVLSSLLYLVFFILARQLVLCGLPFRSLSLATSPLFASVAFAGVAALLTITVEGGDTPEAVFAAMAQLLFCMAAARTRAIWIGSALQFFWGASITVLFGLPSFLWPFTSSVVRSTMAGHRWATGGPFGPEAALWAQVVLFFALVLLWRLTREYAWNYTFDPIVGAGHVMDVAPPAEHTRMEQSVSPLVQIAGVPADAASNGFRSAERE